MKISNPELKVVRFGADDVIATSGLLGALSGTVGTFYIPAGQYSGSVNEPGGNYVEFNGTFGNYDGSNYAIDNIYGAKGGVDDDRNSLVSGSTYIPELGITLPSTVMENMSKNAYDAYSYGGGYYSNGQSYYDIYHQ